MKALMLVVLLGAMPARSEGTNGVAYEAYWLTNKALGQYVKLVLSRRPLTDLPSFSPPTNQTVLDCDAVIVTTYAKDSIWSIDRKPFKPLVGVEKVETNSIVVKGERFACTPAHLEDVLRLLRNPAGIIPIHRIDGPPSPQEEPVRTLAARLGRQPAGGQKAVEVAQLTISFVTPAVAPAIDEVPDEALFPKGYDSLEHGPLTNAVVGRIAGLTVTWADPQRFRTERQTESVLRDLLTSTNTQTYTCHVWSFVDTAPALVASVKHTDGIEGKWVVWVRPGLYWAYRDGNRRWWWGDWNVQNAPYPKSLQPAKDR